VLNVHERTYSTSVVSLGEDYHGAEFEFDDIGHFASGDIDLDRVVGLDIGVRIAQGAAIVRDSDRDLFLADKCLGDTAELVCSFLSVDTVQDESPLRIHEKTKSISRLFELDHIHDASGVVVIGTALTVYLNTTFHADLHAFLVRESVLEAFSEENAHGNALSELVWTRRGPGSKNPAHLGKIPVLRRTEALQVLSRSARPTVTSDRERAMWVSSNGEYLQFQKKAHLHFRLRRSLPKHLQKLRNIHLTNIRM